MSEQPKITIVLLNYQRPQNIPIILNAIKAQTVKATTFLSNSGVVDVNSSLIDHYERPEKNVGCMARWHLAKKATTPYVMSLDDDLCFARDDALEKIILSLETQDNPNRIVGFIGACFDLIPNYNIRREFMCRYGDTNRKTQRHPNTYHINSSKEIVCVKRSLVKKDEPVDMVKGRAMAFNRKLLDGVALPDEREDDIFLSSLFANRARKFHRVSTLLNDVFYELPEFGIGNWRNKEHLSSRNRALRAYFSPGRIVDNRLTRYLLSARYIPEVLSGALLKKMDLLK